MYYGSDFSYKKLQRKLFFRKHTLIFLFFDDIDKIIPLTKKHDTSIREIVNDFRKISSKVQILFTCRKTPWFIQKEETTDFHSHRDDLKEQFGTRILIPRLTEIEVRELADIMGKQLIASFTGNPDEIVLGIIAKRSEYDLLNKDQKNILRSVKIFRMSNRDKPPVESVCLYAFNEFKVETTNCKSIFEQLNYADFFNIIDGRINIMDWIVEEVIYDFPPNLDKTIESLKTTQTDAEKLGDKREELIALVNIGNVYLDANRLSEAEKHFIKAWHIARDMEDDIETLVIQQTLGMIKSNTGRIHEAIAYLSPALMNAKKLGEKKIEEEIEKELFRLMEKIEPEERKIEFSSIPAST